MRCDSDVDLSLKHESVWREAERVVAKDYTELERLKIKIDLLSDTMTSADYERIKLEVARAEEKLDQAKRVAAQAKRNFEQTCHNCGKLVPAPADPDAGAPGAN